MLTSAAFSLLVRGLRGASVSSTGCWRGGDGGRVEGGLKGGEGVGLKGGEGRGGGGGGR